jgi:hypothetical protein
MSLSVDNTAAAPIVAAPAKKDWLFENKMSLMDYCENVIKCDDIQFMDSKNKQGKMWFVGVRGSVFTDHTGYVSAEAAKLIKEGVNPTAHPEKFLVATMREQGSSTGVTTIMVKPKPLPAVATFSLSKAKAALNAALNAALSNTTADGLPV